MRIIPCPVCGTEREVNADELQLVIECNQFMCWDVCGMDHILPPLYLFFHSRWSEEEGE